MHMVTLKTLFSDLLFLHPTCVRILIQNKELIKALFQLFQLHDSIYSGLF